MKEVITELCNIKNRTAATHGEKEAAKYIYNKLKDLGLNPVIENFKFPVSVNFSLILPLVLSIIAAWLPYEYIIFSIILFIISILSFIGEGTTRFDLLRLLLPYGESSNVVAKLEAKDKEKYKIVFSAHYDAPKCGIIYIPTIVNNLGTKFNRLMFPFIFLIALVISSILNIFILKVILTIILGFISLLIIQNEFAPSSPGATDNASGVAIVLSLAKKLINSNNFKNFTFYFVFTGSEEAHLIGMKHFLKRHKKEFDKSNTYFINFDSLGSKYLVYNTSESLLINHKYLPKLPLLVKQLENEFEIKGKHAYGHTDALIPTLYGFNAINFIGYNEHNVPDNYHWFTDTPENLNINTILNCEKVVFRLLELLKLS